MMILFFFSSFRPSSVRSLYRNTRKVQESCQRKIPPSRRHLVANGSDLFPSGSRGDSYCRYRSWRFSLLHQSVMINMIMIL
ncbi:hypothetical protein BDW42DRAFT_176892 [Aspergillus taichungensis]|uniref:Uncharacterized protein n=1 Tax=Aspergillus taichungensis TaxID=482145 RepID=A0A2J5HJX8_9EURO|nr:hypothetical protein BDW42DRAFT_176892 [Aspergillus taichungensis]